MTQIVKCNDTKMKNNRVIKYNSRVGESEMTEELFNYVTMIYIFIIMLIMDILKYIFN
jgi:hypothetical protein